MKLMAEWPAVGAGKMGPAQSLGEQDQIVEKLTALIGNEVPEEEKKETGLSVEDWNFWKDL